MWLSETAKKYNELRLDDIVKSAQKNGRTLKEIENIKAYIISGYELPYPKSKKEAIKMKKGKDYLGGE